MRETIKQSVARARGKIFVLLDPRYSEFDDPERIAVSKLEARRVIDAAPNYAQTSAVWEGDDLVLHPNCSRSDPA